MVEIIHEQQDQLIPIREHDGQQAVSGRDLHSFLGLGRDYTTWFKKMTEYGFVEGQDYLPISGEVAREGRGSVERKDHAITLDMAKELSMIQRTERGKQARQYFIECEKQMKAQPSRALTFEEKTLEVLQGLSQQVETQRRALAVAKPKAEAYDDFLSDGGDYDRRGAASILSRRHGVNIGQNQLTDLLISWGWIGEDRRPKYPYTAREYFTSRPYKDPILNEKTGQYFTPAPQLRITAKGIDAIAKRIKRAEATPKEIAA